jgi:CHASE1-domain containing sensor protein
MSETWTSLLAALVGAIVGGAASLAATMVVNKQQMATNAQMRLYDELLPKL